MVYDLQPPLPPTATPKDYHRVHFDPSHLPTTRIVGLLACQRDPLLRELKSRVVKVAEAQIAEPPAAKGRAKQKKKTTDTPSSSGAATPIPNVNGNGHANGHSTVEGGEAKDKGKLWEISLEDTVIFPEGGGQPFDTGLMIYDGEFSGVTGEKVELVIEGCLRRKLESVHLVRVPSQSEDAVKQLEGKEVIVKVDWERRMDHMSIHTAQHLLSAILDTYAEGLPTMSWGFAAHPSLDPPYVELPRSLTWTEAEEVERKCNEAIERAVKIWVDVDVQQEGYIKQSASGVRENRGIPEDYTDGVIRHIIIDGIDKNACCGTQLPHLGLIQFLHILPPSTPSTSSTPTKTPSRLFFVAGPRAVKALQHTSRQLSLAAQSISVGRNDLVERVEKMDTLRKDTLSREKDLRIELARVIGENTTVDDPHRVVFLKRTDKATHDFEFITAIGTAINGAKVTVLLSTPSGTETSLIVVLSPDNDLARSTNEAIKSAMNALGGGGVRYKGGGAKGRYMGKVEGKWGKEEDEALTKVVDGLRK